MEDFFFAHHRTFENVEQVSAETRREVEEIVSLLELKCDCELSYARSLRKVGQFRLSNLLGTTFEPVVESIKNKALNKSSQQIELVESIRRDVLEPLRQSVLVQNREAKLASIEGKQSMKNMKEEELQLRKV